MPERYEQCETRKALNREFKRDATKYHAGTITRDEMIDCEIQYSKRFRIVLLNDLVQVKRYEE